MALVTPTAVRLLRAWSISILSVALLASGNARSASGEERILHEKMVTLRQLPQASFEWQLRALEIARMLKALPASEDRTALVRAFRSEVEGFVRSDASAVAEERIRIATEAWVQRVGRALSAQGLEFRTRAQMARGTWTAFIDFAQMRDSLARKLFAETDLASSARQAGFDRIEFVNTGSGKSWGFALGGGEALRAAVLRDAAVEWGIEQL